MMQFVFILKNSAGAFWMSRYTVHGDEGVFQPGSDGLVLRNRASFLLMR